MPLDHDHLTVASRVMLPTYAILCGLWGVAFTIDPLGRLGRAASLNVARSWLPLEVWGAMWLTLAALLLIARVRKSRPTAIYALGIGAATWAAWSVVIEAAVFTSPDVTLIAGTLPATISIAHIASMLSLQSREACHAWTT